MLQCTDDANVKAIYKAIAMWQERTCLTFIDLDVSEQYKDQHLLFMKTQYMSG